MYTSLRYVISYTKAKSALILAYLLHVKGIICEKISKYFWYRYTPIC
jgi:hypothetical protein